MLAQSLLLVAFFAADLDYKPYASADGRYKTLFPGAVKTETKEVEAGGKKLTLTLDSVEVSDGVFFLVTYIDAPDDVAKLPAAMRLDKLRDGNKGDDGKVILDKPIEVGVEKLPGRDLLIEKKDFHLRNRAVIAGNRVYQVMVQGTKDYVTSKETDRFFDAFEVTK
ncbi:MAG: hypothetical protein U0791_25530 [Gemmataceae bacterium]